ncbi:MAG TPA: hypothetical protein VFX16_32730 [Pseudonocardiaceae bacterium]|nr:hypothetical protein [Pseudonocardiaceae bacterium]
MTERDRLAAALAAAAEFVRTQAGFAQVTTLDAAGFPTARTVSAFLSGDWTVRLVQRDGHRRLGQLRRDPRLLVTWSGSPAASSVNESPAVFDLGLLIPRVVFVQGVAAEMDEAQTWATYRAHDQRLRDRGNTRAPVRDRANVAAELTGFTVRPRRVRLEGFGAGPEAFTWSCEVDSPPPMHKGDETSC